MPIECCHEGMIKHPPAFPADALTGWLDALNPRPVPPPHRAVTPMVLQAAADSAACPKCGHGLHALTNLDECPWWRFASRWGDPTRAINAIPEITTKGIAHVHS